MALTKARLLKHDFPVHGNTFSDSIAKRFRACFPGVLHWYVRAKQSTEGGVSHPVGGVLGWLRTYRTIGVSQRYYHTIPRNGVTGCGFFAYNWKLPAYSGGLLLMVDNLSFFTYSFFVHNFSFFTYNWSSFAYSGKVCLIRALRDCKQRSFTVGRKCSNCK